MLLLHPVTKHQLLALKAGKPQAVIVYGGGGAGKQTVAETLIDEITGHGRVTNDAYYLEITPDPSSIGVEAIRQIREFLSKKTLGSDVLRRVILILDAHTMTIEAQNALLKTLEEPPEDTLIVLTVNDLTKLKPTIRSRSQLLMVLPVTEESATDYFKQKGHSEASVQNAYHISSGLMGLMTALLADAPEHDMVASIDNAKTLLRKTTYDRLAQVDKLSKQKEDAAALLLGLERVVSGGLHMSAKKDNKSAVKSFYNLSKLVYEAQDAIGKSGNTKLVLTKLFINM